MMYVEARDDLVRPPPTSPCPRPPPRRAVRAGHPAILGADRPAGGQDALVDDAVLLTSELVTNAVLHAGTPVQVTCRLLGDEPGGAVEIAVLDRQPAQLQSRPAAYPGRGGRAHQRPRAAAAGRAGLGVGCHVRAGRQGGVVPAGPRVPADGLTSSRPRPGTLAAIRWRACRPRARPCLAGRDLPPRLLACPRWRCAGG